jgi:AcrR family transcriptional regulator
VARLLAAGLAEFAERGFQAVTVDDIVGRAKTSHGTFYLYFTNKDDFFRALAAEALQAMDRLSDEFPVVTANAAGRAALRQWITAFCDAYAAHATVLRIISHADTTGPDVWEDGLKYLLRMADVVSMGMTVAAADGQNAGDRRVSVPGSRLSAVICLMMLERVNYLLSSGIQLPRAELIDRLTAIMAAAFGHRDQAPALSRDRDAADEVEQAAVERLQGVLRAQGHAVGQPR